MAKLNFQWPLLQYLMSHENTEIIQTCWFGAQENFLIHFVKYLTKIVLSKDPVLRYQVGTKKNENITVPGFVKCRGPGQPGSWRVGPYDFCDTENPDWIAVTS